MKTEALVLMGSYQSGEVDAVHEGVTSLDCLTELIADVTGLRNARVFEHNAVKGLAGAVRYCQQLLERHHQLFLDGTT